MNGLLQQEQPQQAQQAQQQGQQPGDMQQKGQQVYKKIVEMALGFAYSEQGTAMIKQGLELQGGDFTKNAGNVMAKLMMRIMISASTAGKKLPPKMLFQAGMEIASAITEMGQAMGVTDGEKGVAKSVFYAGLTIAGRELPDEVLTPQEKQEFVALIRSVQQLDSQGGKQQEEQREPQDNPMEEQQERQQPGGMQ